MSGQFRNIIFDFGGVILPVEPMAYAVEMQRLGCADLQALHENFLKSGIYLQFEKGLMQPDEFRNALRSGMNRPVSDGQLDAAWNRMLGEIPQEIVNFLSELKTTFRTFLLSNTNLIHHRAFNDRFCRSFGFQSLDDLFEKAYYSYRLGMAKPGHDIFEWVLHDSGLIPGETLFIDDNADNVSAANHCGIRAVQIHPGNDLPELVHAALHHQYI